jgi:catechol 2,3-dioxygenase-like lactoylglutathione lyase family enzyme
MVDLQRPVLDIGLVVRDFEGALEFYRDKLGFVPTRQIDVDDVTARQTGLAAAGFDIQYMQVGDVNLKLIRMKNPPSTAPTDSDPVYGYRYVTMWVEDMDRTYDEWRANGVEFLCEPIRRTPDLRVVVLKDPEGNLIEILGP